MLHDTSPHKVGINPIYGAAPVNWGSGKLSHLSKGSEFVSKLCSTQPWWLWFSCVCADCVRTDAFSRLRAEGSPHSKCESSPWHCFTGFEQQFSVIKGQQMKSEREIPIPSLQKHNFEILSFKSQKQVFLFRLHGESDESWKKCPWVHHFQNFRGFRDSWEANHGCKIKGAPFEAAPRSAGPVEV